MGQTGSCGQRRVVRRRAGGLEGVEFQVGNDVWFGGHVTVLPGVTIGDGSVIGAGSVVTRDIPPGVVAAGNPCRVLRPVTEKDRILQGGLPPRH